MRFSQVKTSKLIKAYVISQVAFVYVTSHCIALAQSATATTTASPLLGEASITTPAAEASGEPGAGALGCAVVSSLSAQYKSFNPSATGLPTIPIGDAYDCLNSVPIIERDALALLDGMVPYLQFQSTLAYLKDPPTGYPFPAVDIMDGIQKLRARVINDTYGGEYAFQIDLWNLINSAHDGHFRWTGDILATALVFDVGYQLVSVSEDGQVLPSVYLLEDIQLPTGQTSLSYTPSAVVTVDGHDTVSTLEELSLDNWLQDLDALYNTNFFEIAQIPVNYDQFTVPRFRYPGGSTTFAFANGTSRTYLHQAIVVGDFDNVNSGDAFYTKFCNGILQPRSLPNSESAADRKPRTPPGYPEPILIHSDYSVGGYYLNDTGFEDVAVLSLLGFSYLHGGGGVEFQSVVQNFLAAAKAAGKTKLIVDLQANGGGIVDLGYDTFLQLFPNIDPYGASVFRAHDGLNFLGNGISQRVQSIGSNDIQDLEEAGAALSLNYVSDLDMNGTAFSSWKELYGPQLVHDDNFTSLIRVNLDYPLRATDIDPSIVFTGHGDRSNFTTPPFPPEDIIMVTDGFCTSTCNTFVEFMKTQAGVKSIVFGGRPENRGSMQTVGGARGFEVQYFFNIFQFIRLAAGLTSSVTDKAVEGYISSNLASTDLANISSYVLGRSALASVNAQSNIRMNDITLTPLQFVYDAADCRLWYTPKMINDISEIWRVAANAAWSNITLCVAGSTGAPSSLSGFNPGTSSNSSSANSIAPYATSNTPYANTSSPSTTSGPLAASVSLLTGSTGISVGSTGLSIGGTGLPVGGTRVPMPASGIPSTTSNIISAGSILPLASSALAITTANASSSWSSSTPTPHLKATSTSGGTVLRLGSVGVTIAIIEILKAFS